MGFVTVPSGDAASTASTASSEHTTPRTPKERTQMLGSSVGNDNLLPSRSTLIHSKAFETSCKIADKAQQPWPKDMARRRYKSRPARSSSEGCIRKRSMPSSKTEVTQNRPCMPSSKTEVTQKPFRSGFIWSDERQHKSISSCSSSSSCSPQAPETKCLEAPRRTATPMNTQRPQRNSISTGLIPPTAAEVTNSHSRDATPSQAEPVAEHRRTSDQNLHTDISSLVEELFALIVDNKPNSAGASAASQSSNLPRPLEAAAAALEPLLLLRDATGSLESLELMPWLPQLLTVFRNVMRTSVHGIAAQQQGDRAAAAEAAAAAAAVVAALSAPPLTQLTGEAAGTNDCRVLREKLHSQELALKIARQREEQLEQELLEVQRERDYLIEMSGNPKLMCCVSELEQENRVCKSELSSIEDRISDLVSIVGAALEA